MAKYEFPKFLAPKKRDMTIVGGWPEKTSDSPSLSRSTQDSDYADYGKGYLTGGGRDFGTHGVCLECGAMVDREFLKKHAAYHAKSA